MTKKNETASACKNTKVAVIGAGSVGATTAFSLLNTEAIDHLIIFDKDGAKAEGISLDLSHASPFTPNVKVHGSNNYNDLANADIFIITAGKRQSPGETRLDLTKANKAIFDELIPNLVQQSPNAIFIMVTNPVDILTYYAITKFKLSAQRVFGTGTMLDTARFQEIIANKIGVSPHSIDAYILGEHGDSSFPVLSCATVAGTPLTSFPGMSETILRESFTETKNAAYKIINDIGFTCYSIAMVVSTLVKAIVHNSHEAFMLSTLVSNYYGISDVCLSVPVIVGQNGIESHVDLPLNNEEVECLKNSAKILKSFQ